MPYIAIKAWPKDDETKKKVTEEINDVFLKYWGCPQEAISISIDAIPKEEWEARIREPEILPNKDIMMILDGEKQY